MTMLPVKTSSKWHIRQWDVKLWTYNSRQNTINHNITIHSIIAALFLYALTDFSLQLFPLLFVLDYLALCILKLVCNESLYFHQYTKLRSNIITIKKVEEIIYVRCVVYVLVNVFTFWFILHSIEKLILFGIFKLNAYSYVWITVE